MEDDNDIWTENTSKLFIDISKYCVPEREDLNNIICKLLSSTKRQQRFWELSMGEGLLMEQILSKFPNCELTGFDISNTMIAETNKRLKGFKGKYELVKYNMESLNWRNADIDIDGIVSSLAIHHLDDKGKKQLYTDMYRLLSPGGILIVADLIRPKTKIGWEIAAEGWDNEVKKRSMLFDGNLTVYENFVKQNWNLYSDPEPDPIDKPSPIYDQLKWLDEIGYQDIDVYWMRGGHILFAGYKRIENE
jgi:tRNA (cmo5U34)-methyltransferase